MCRHRADPQGYPCALVERKGPPGEARGPRLNDTGDAVMLVTMTTASKTPVSLDQFDANLDAQVGARQEFAATVRGLAAVRHELAGVQARRREIFEVIKAHFERGDCRPSDGSDRMLRITKPAAVHRKTAPSAVVKKRDKALWEAARIVTPYVQAAPPKTHIQRAVEGLPGVPDGRDLAVTMAAYQLLAPRIKQLNLAEEAAVDALKKIGANTGWDGLPQEFADGWKVSLVHLQYSSDRLAEIAPQLFAELAVESVSAPAGHVFIGRVGSEEPWEGE